MIINTMPSKTAAITRRRFYEVGLPLEGFGVRSRAYRRPQASGRTANCSGTYENVSSAFGGATSPATDSKRLGRAVPKGVSASPQMG
jgi:hypothetical protein